MSRVPGIVTSSNILANEFASNETENQSRFVYELIAYAWRLKQFEDSIFLFSILVGFHRTFFPKQSLSYQLIMS